MMCLAISVAACSLSSEGCRHGLQFLQTWGKAKHACTRDRSYKRVAAAATTIGRPAALKIV